MLLKYGTYEFADDEPQVSIDVSRMFNEAKQAISVRHTWTINGVLHGASQSALKTALDDLNTAFSRDYRDLILYQDDESSVAHQLLNAGSESGVRVIKPPSFPDMTGAVWSTFLPYSIVVEAEYAFNSADLSQLESWTEQLTIGGGGPVREVVELTLGLPEIHTTRARTAYRATQSGQAAGKFRYPPVPPPVFGVAKLIESPQVSYVSPRRVGPTIYTTWAVSWNYVFASATPLVGLPTVWIG